MLTSFNNDRWTVVFLLFAVTISLPSHCQGKTNLEWWSRRYVVESKVYGMCMRVLIRLILFRLRTENMIFSPCLHRHFFLGDEKRNCRLRRKEETHTHRFFGWREGKGKRENSDVSSSAKCVVRLHYQFLC
jgi:hypothetical protein